MGCNYRVSPKTSYPGELKRRRITRGLGSSHNWDSSEPGHQTFENWVINGAKKTKKLNRFGQKKKTKKKQKPVPGQWRKRLPAQCDAGSGVLKEVLNGWRLGGAKYLRAAPKSFTT